MVNNPEEDEEEINAAGIRNQPARNPVKVSHGWGNENAPTLAPRMLGISGGAAGRFTKQATMFPAKGNTSSAGTKSQALHSGMVGVNGMIQNTVGGGNGMGGGT